MTTKKSTTAANTIKHAYEASVKARALMRAGGCNNLNGHILEIMGADKTNLNPVNWVRGISEKLTSSTTAKTVDSVIMKGGKVIGRVQYKDTPKGITDTIRRVKSGQYNSATLKGTTETARKFNAAAEKAGIAKRMKDTGISGRTTKALGRACGACKQTSLARACAWSARSGGIWGGAISGGISAVSNIAAVCNGEKGIYHCLIVSQTAPETVVSIHGGFAPNAIPDRAEAVLKQNGPVPESTDSAKVSAKNGLLTVTAFGKGGHASMPEGTVNAIAVLIDYLLENHLVETLNHHNFLDS